MRKVREVEKIRKNLKRDDSTWSNERCIHCEILIVQTLDKVPSYVRNPLWHIDSGSNVCMLCRAESIVASKGLDPVDVFDPIVAKLFYQIYRIARKKLEGDQALDQGENLEAVLN